MAPKCKEAKLTKKKEPVKGKRISSKHAPEVVRESNIEQTSKLLELSPELRNRIYDLILLTGEEIMITKSTKPPALPQVCRQIRSECRTMWFLSNSFTIVVKRCDTLIYRRWNKLISTLPDTAECNIGIDCHGASKDYCWNGMKQWAKAVWQGRLDVFESGGVELNSVLDNLVLYEAIAMVTRVAEEFRGKKWRDCKAAILELREKNALVESIFGKGEW